MSSSVPDSQVALVGLGQLLHPDPVGLGQGAREAGGRAGGDDRRGLCRCYRADRGQRGRRRDGRCTATGGVDVGGDGRGGQGGGGDHDYDYRFGLSEGRFSRIGPHSWTQGPNSITDFVIIISIMFIHAHMHTL